MKPHFCSRQQETTQALHKGTFSAELQAHIAECHDCSELLTLSQAFRQSRAEAMQAARLDSPALLWWRAQLRQRYSGVERVTRPVVLVERFALLSTVVAALAIVAWQRSAILDWMGSITDALQSSSLPGSSGGWMVAVIVAGAGALISFSGLAMYLLAKHD